MLYAKPPSRSLHEVDGTSDRLVVAARRPADEERVVRLGRFQDVLAKADRRVVFVTGDLGFSVVERFMADLPDQFVNAGVAEQNMTSLAAGRFQKCQAWRIVSAMRRWTSACALAKPAAMSANCSVRTYCSS